MCTVNIESKWTPNYYPSNLQSSPNWRTHVITDICIIIVHVYVCNLSFTYSAPLSSTTKNTNQKKQKQQSKQNQQNNRNTLPPSPSSYNPMCTAATSTRSSTLVSYLAANAVNSSSSVFDPTRRPRVYLGLFTYISLLSHPPTTPQ